MSKKSVVIVCILLLCLGIFSFFLNPEKQESTLRIGILIPMDHMALREIVAGFKESVSKHFPGNVTFQVQSAEGDLKLQRSIIDMFIGQKIDLIVPIGTSATQMTLSLVKEQPIVSLAAQFDEKQRLQRIPQNITGIIDEIGGKKKIEFIHKIMPTLKILTLIADSGNEKNFEEIKDLQSESLKCGITLQVILIKNLPELEMAANAIDPKTEVILVGKDHLIASGVRMLVNIAKQRGIPLLTSDEGTVREGATMALGVLERSIGTEGGNLAIKVLEGQEIAHLLMQQIQNLVVFLRAEDCKLLNIDLTKVRAFARDTQAELIPVDD